MPTVKPTVMPTAAPECCFALVRNDTGTYVINNTGADAEVTVIIAKYGGGSLEKVEIKKEGFAAGEIKSYIHNENARLFVWDSVENMRPLTI